ncbi:DUF6705 family protein [Flavobacterium sp.]|uniref:DUF6705 family protein n=1 Tax=Flavobacterium sp. TaxID=239 RepID=UPI002FD8FFEE
MKQIFITFTLIFYCQIISAQYTGIQSLDGWTNYLQGVYYKDVANVLNPFEGHYKYESNSILFEIKIQKREVFYNGYNYQDILIGSYLLIKENIVEIDVLNDINNNHNHYSNYYLYGNEIMTGKVRGCDECAENEKWVIATIIEPDTGAADKIHMRKLIVNGQPTLRIFIYPVSQSRHQNDGPTPMQKYPVGISFDLVQIP